MMKDNINNKIINNVYYFKNDEEFYNWAINPVIVYKEDYDSCGKKIKYFDFELSSEYNDAIKNGISFCIRDKNSQIFKRKAVSYRTITKKIEGLKPYYGERKHKKLID